MGIIMNVKTTINTMLLSQKLLTVQMNHSEGDDTGDF